MKATWCPKCYWISIDTEECDYCGEPYNPRITMIEKELNGIKVYQVVKR